MSREEMIQMLVFDSLEQGSEIKGYCWLQHILESGFTGFANMSDKELEAHCQARKLHLHGSLMDEDADSIEGEDIGDTDIYQQGLAGLPAMEGD